MITDITKQEMKYLTRSNLGIKAKSPDFKHSEHAEFNNILKLDVYRQYWEALHDFRERFRKNVDFLRGRQLEEWVTNDAGETVKESEYISEQGKTPFVQNIIRPAIKSIEGLFRQDIGSSVVVSRKPDSARVEKMLSNALQSVLHLNETREIDPRTLDYFLLSGFPAQRVGFDYLSEKERFDIVIDYLDPNYLFFNNDIKDIRGKDLRLIGQLHDLVADDLYVHFADSAKDKNKLKRLYRMSEYETPNYETLTSDRVKNLDFYVPQEIHKCRVIEVWEKKAVDVIEVHDEADGQEYIWDDSVDNLNRIAEARYQAFRQEGYPEEEIPRIHYKYKVVYRWFYKFLTPWGHVLKEGESPYTGYTHPFVLGPYPLISGEIWGLVEDLIDTQKQYNRLYTLYDFILGTSAKNTLILDEASLNGQRPEDIAEDYRRVGGVVVLKLKDGAKPPQELKGASPDRAITEMIKMYADLMQNISGVQSALQGQAPGSGVPASRFMAETQNSIINLKEMLDFFASFRKKRDMKVLNMIIQFYKTERYLAISGDGNNEDKFYDPALAKETASDLDLVVSKSQDSPVYKALNDEILKDFTLQGLIGIEQFLKHTDYSFSKSLLEDIQNTREQMQQGAVPQEAMGQLAQKQA
jgi:hypothetical protein